MPNIIAYYYPHGYIINRAEKCTKPFGILRFPWNNVLTSMFTKVAP